MVTREIVAADMPRAYSDKIMSSTWPRHRLRFGHDRRGGAAVAASGRPVRWAAFRDWPCCACGRASFGLVCPSGTSVGGEMIESPGNGKALLTVSHPALWFDIPAGSGKTSWGEDGRGCSR